MEVAMFCISEKVAGERRTIDIKAIAEKTGILLDDGALWDGIERRKEQVDPPQSKEASKAEGRATKKNAPDFFG